MTPTTPIFRTLALCLAALGLVLPAAGDLPVTNGLALWLDASQLTGLTNGQQVDTWTDMSGTANHANRNAGSTADYPHYVTNELNDLPVVRFSTNGNSYYNFNNISAIRSVFWVIKETTPARHHLLGDNAGTFHRSTGGSYPMWSIWTHPNITSGVTKLMGTVVNGLTTPPGTGGYRLVSLVTVGNVPADRITYDRAVANTSWDGDIAELLIYTSPLSASDELSVGAYLAAKYNLTTDYPLTPQAFMLDFGISGMPAVINHDTTNITWTVPHDTDVTSLAPEYTLSPGATCDIPSGSAPNFTTSVVYTVTSSDSGSVRRYVVTVVVTPVSTEKEMLQFGPGAVIDGQLVSWRVPYGSDLTTLAPACVVSPKTTCDPVSGATNDFSLPVIYTVTAEDLSTKQYVVIASVSPQPWINVNYDYVEQTGLVGPAGGSGDTWNQVVKYTNMPRTTTDGPFLDAAGNTTVVSVVSALQFQWSWTTPLTMLAAGRTPAWGVGTANLDIQRLDPARSYDVYIACYKQNGNGARGLFWTSNITAAASTNRCNNGGVNGVDDVWIEGTNYVKFIEVAPDTASNITIVVAGDVDQAYVNGFQLVDMGHAPCVAITSIDGSTNVPFGTASYPVAGTNNGFTVGGLWWSSSSGSSGTVPADGGTGTGWTFNAGLATGPNFVTISGSNNVGNVRSDYVSITVIPEPATAGAVAVIGVGHLLRSHSLFVVRRKRQRRSASLSAVRPLGRI